MSRTIFEQKYYVLENITPLETDSRYSSIKMFDKNKFYMIYHIHGSGTIYTLTEGYYNTSISIPNRDNLVHISKTFFQENFFTQNEIRKLKIQKLNK